MRATRSTPFLLALLSTACTSGIEQEVLPEELAAVYCESVDACGGTLVAVLLPGETCEQSFSGAVRNTLLASLDDLLARGTTTYDGAAAATCLEEVRALGCDLFIAPTAPSCRLVLVGSAAPGERCSVTAECEAGAYCDSPMCPTAEGTCAVRKANGATCADGDECQDGLVCHEGSCSPNNARSGGPCGGSTNLNCPIGEFCRGAEGETPGTCTETASLQTATLGEDCEIVDGGPEILCQDGLHCAAVGIEGLMPDFECVEPATAGGTCNTAVPDMCPTGQYCDAQPRMLMFEGDCVALPTANQPCATVDFGLRCAAGLACADNTCVQPVNNGAACTVNGGCYSGRCDDGICAGPELCAG